MRRKQTAWTVSEDTFLRENAPNMTVKQLTAGLIPISPIERHVENVRYQCRKRGISPLNSGRHFWTDEEEQFVRENYGVLGLEKTAKHIGVTKTSIKHKIAKPGFFTSMEKQTPWMETMLETIEDVGKSIYDLSVELLNAGKYVEIEENTEGKLALFARVRR